MGVGSHFGKEDFLPLQCSPRLAMERRVALGDGVHGCRAGGVRWVAVRVVVGEEC
jgi:hypothetical protein